jgi:phosphatidylserine/phosphatidylglycerophosphate/cardiolipin synthase-like enzyme
MARIRVQRGCHTKGIVVDSRAVLVGSHNWSNDGVCYSRDASFILFDADVAAYYERLFLHDWERLARQKVAFESAMPLVTDATDVPELGLVRLPWTTIYED